MIASSRDSVTHEARSLDRDRPSSPVCISSKRGALSKWGEAFISFEQTLYSSQIAWESTKASGGRQMRAFCIYTLGICSRTQTLPQCLCQLLFFNLVTSPLKKNDINQWRAPPRDNRLLRTSLEGGGGGGRSGGKGGSIARVDMNTVVLERLLDTYARMTVDADSYVYLAAVQGLAALADALPGWCIPRLVGLFVASAPAGAEDEAAPGTEVAAAGAQLSLSQRLKIGEAVVLSARRCGDAMPKYAHLFVNAFVVGARERSTRDRSGAGNRTSPGSLATRKKASCSEGTAHRAELKGQSIAATNVEQDGRGGVGRSLGPKEFDERAGGDIERDGTVDNGESLEMSLESRERYHFRASCLSNLAEVCQLLRWSLGKFSQDIVDLGVGVLRMETSSSEEAVLARRGAAFLLSRLLQGAGSDVLEVMLSLAGGSVRPHGGVE